MMPAVNRTLKRILLVVAAVVVLGGIATVYYVYFYDQADEEFSQADVDDRLDQVTVPGSSEGTATDDSTGGTSAPAGDGVDGTWAIAAESEVGYRVNEVINGLDKIANGRTTSVIGSLTIAGTVVSEGGFTVDMASIESGESRRDGQFRTRIMSVDEFPTATFTLTAPIDFGEIPAEGGTVTAEATGDLTLHGVTKTVTFEVQATFKNGLIGVLGQIPVVFAEYEIPNPSFASITTEDHGLLEFVLVFARS